MGGGGPPPGMGMGPPDLMMDHMGPMLDDLGPPMLDDFPPMRRPALGPPRIVVGNLPRRNSRQDLESRFARYGPIIGECSWRTSSPPPPFFFFFRD